MTWLSLFDYFDPLLEPIYLNNPLNDVAHNLQTVTILTTHLPNFMEIK